MGPRITSPDRLRGVSPQVLSPVERRLSCFPPSLRWRLSVLLLILWGGVSSDGRWGRSVGRSTAGIYNGDFGGRNWRVVKGRLENVKRERGDIGDTFNGVSESEAAEGKC